MTDFEDPAEERFRAFYSTHLPALLAYAVRRVDRPEEAADVVADTFLVAWRRRDSLPTGDEGRLWLYGVARKALANHHRGSRRRERLGLRLRERLAAWPAPDPADEVVQGAAVREALGRLSAADRELLGLSVWEGLKPAEIAVVLRLPVGTVRTRLSRARARMREQLGGEPPGPSPVVRAVLATEEIR